MIDDITPLDPLSTPAMYKRAEVVSIARTEIGKRDAAKYWEGVLPSGPPYPKHWCGGFALWVLRTAGLAPDVPWGIGRGFCYRLPITNHPQIGDIAYFDQPYQHHAVVVEVSDRGLVTVDGNQSGETVAERVGKSRSAVANRPVAS
jgi:hypothetical protein